jgi:hypothetical protein
MLVTQYHEAVAAAIAATTAATATITTNVKWIHHHVFVSAVPVASFRSVYVFIFYVFGFGTN